jgi:hypothetical protein
MKPQDETMHRERLFHSSNQTCKDDVALLETVYKTQHWDWPYRNNWCENVMEYVSKLFLIDLCACLG